MSFDQHRHVISIEIDEAQLGRYSDAFLATAWHVAQANPAPHGDPTAGRLAERIGREIIGRWLAGTAPELWHHQGRDYAHNWLTTFATYRPGGPSGSPDFYAGTWVLKDHPDETPPDETRPDDTRPDEQAGRAAPGEGGGSDG